MAIASAADSVVTQPLEALLSRVSISQLQEPAPDGHALDLILQAAMRAPDHGRLRPWRFVLIRNGLRTALADLLEAALRRRNSDVSEDIVRRQRLKPMSTPLTIVVGAHIQPGSNIPEIEQMLSIGAAAMNMLNAIHALGFGGIWVTGPNSYDPFVAAALGFHAPDRLAGFLFVGTPLDQPRGRHRPDPGDYTVEWNGEVKDKRESS
jgi:nitroreductase